MPSCRIAGLVVAVLASTAVVTCAARCSVRFIASNTHQVDLSCPTTDRVRFIGLADWGEEFEAAYVLAVRDGVLKQAATGDFDFILTAGDNIYANGVDSTTDPLWQSIWQSRWHIGTDLKLPWMAVVGNHDHYGSADAQVQFHTSNQPGSEYWFMPSTRYSINVATNDSMLKIVTVDTVTLNAADIKWAALELNDSRASFSMVAGHYQMYSLDERGDAVDAPMVQLNKVIQSTPKAKAYLCGHEHSMQYFTASNKDYFTFGGSGRTIYKQNVFPSTKATKQYYSHNYGFATFDVQVAQRRMTVTYYVYDASGKSIAQPSFTRQY